MCWASTFMYRLFELSLSSGRRLNQQGFSLECLQLFKNKHPTAIDKNRKNTKNVSIPFIAIFLPYMLNGYVELKIGTPGKKGSAHQDSTASVQHLPAPLLASDNTGGAG